MTCVCWAAASGAPNSHQQAAVQHAEAKPHMGKCQVEQFACETQMVQRIAGTGGHVRFMSQPRRALELWACQ